MTITSSDILNLAERQKLLDYRAFISDRKKNGFTHFIPDLSKGQPAEGKGWKIGPPPFPGPFTSGYLVVQTNHDTAELTNYLENNLGHHAWFETTNKLEDKKKQYALANNGAEFVVESPQLPEGYEVYKERFKTLGYFGANPAMDIGVLIINDGKLYIKMIQRPDKKYAFVGGMVDKNFEAQSEALVNKCIQEFIEELYSNDIFATNSATLRAAEKITPQNAQQALANVLKNDEFKNLSAIAEQIIPILGQNGVAFANRINNLDTQLRLLGQKQGIRAEDLDVFWVRIKCKLYQELFSAQYNDLCKFLKENMVRMPVTINECDGRNTQVAFMVTHPHYIVAEMQALLEMENKWLVKPKGGDDAISTKILPLDTLFTKQIFSSHARILLEMLADFTENNPVLLQSTKFQAQLEQIKSIIETRELQELGSSVSNNSLPVAGSSQQGMIHAYQNSIVNNSGQPQTNQGDNKNESNLGYKNNTI